MAGTGGGGTINVTGIHSPTARNCEVNTVTGILDGLHERPDVFAALRDEWAELAAAARPCTSVCADCRRRIAAGLHDPHPAPAPANGRPRS